MWLPDPLDFEDTDRCVKLRLNLRVLSSNDAGIGALRHKCLVSSTAQYARSETYRSVGFPTEYGGRIALSNVVAAANDDSVVAKSGSVQPTHHDRKTALGVVRLSADQYVIGSIYPIHRTSNHSCVLACIRVANASNDRAVRRFD
jgi:hypothetical protein